jgi:hypothetical protein
MCVQARCHSPLPSLPFVLSPLICILIRLLLLWCACVRRHVDEIHVNPNAGVSKEEGHGNYSVTLSDLRASAVGRMHDVMKLAMRSKFPQDRVPLRYDNRSPSHAHSNDSVWITH